MTPNYRRTVIALAERALADFGGQDLSRESADLLLMLWPCNSLLDDELRADVLSRFPKAEPPSVPGLDWLPAVEADAATLVAEAVAVLDEPKAEEHEAVSMVDDRGADGWVAECRCGFRTAPYIKRSDARQTIDAHIRLSRKLGFDPLLIESVKALSAPTLAQNLPAPPRRWQDRDGQFWSVGSDELISLETERGPSRLFVLATVEELEELYGPLVEVTP